MADRPSSWGDLRGRVIHSTVQAGVSYELQRVLGRGGMGTAYLAARYANRTSARVVVKVINPTATGEEGAHAALAIQKEAVALGRLNEQVPPTPYVVRLVDTGSIETMHNGAQLSIPWIAVEYVHGGPDGTTLEQRVGSSVEGTAHAFTTDRAAQAVRCLALGVDAVHGVGVIHRDLKPSNVLCCGFGREEVLKIADFGIARPTGMAATYGAASIGTPGYAAPEQAFTDHGPITTAADIFALGAITFYLLTGEDLFDGHTVVQTVLASLNAHRRSLLDCPKLCEELRSQPHACHVIDQAIARATAGNASDRQPDAATFSAAVLGALDQGPLSVRPSRAFPLVARPRLGAREAGSFTFDVLSPPSPERVARRGGWTADAQCLVPTNRGLEHWDGQDWRFAQVNAFDASAALFARALRPGFWLVGGARGLLAVYEAGREAQVVPPPHYDLDILGADGDPADLMVCATLHRDRGDYALTAMAARRWVRPVPAPAQTVINDLCRVDHSRWLVCGRDRSGKGFAAIYEPLMWRLEPIDVGQCALVAAGGQAALGEGIAVGRGGVVLDVAAGGARLTTMPLRADCAAAALDVGGGAWAGSVGRILRRAPGGGWQEAWTGDLRTPFTSLHADVGVVHGMTVDGAIVVGRAEQ